MKRVIAIESGATRHEFDYRYSIQPQVFASLIRDGKIAEYDLYGLASAKLDAIRHMIRS